MKNASLYNLSSYIFLLLFFLLSFVWLYGYNSYNIINFLEESQLFRTDKYYFQEYLNRPGGLIQYIASFFTQFYKSHIVGGLILSLFLTSIAFMQKIIFKRDGNANLFLGLFFITPLLLLFSCSDVMHFRLDNILGIAFILTLFWIYVLLKGKLKYIAGIALYFLAYFITGGNAILLAALMLIHAVFEEKRSYIFMLVLLLLAIAVPFLAFKFIYISTLKQAYLAVTPYSFSSSNTLYPIAWYAVPILYLLWRISAKSLSSKKINAWVLIVPYFLLFAAISIWGVKKYSSLEGNYILRMAHEVEKGNWDKVIDLGDLKKISKNWNPVPFTYFTNIALSEKGRLASDLFNYEQTGTYGLFLTWQIHYTTSLFIGELYYRMGLIQEAEHCAFEAMVCSYRDYSSKAVRRLVTISMLKRDKENFEKRIRLLENSPVYKAWAKEQRVHFENLLADTNYKIPGTPQPIHVNNFMVDYTKPPNDLFTLLEVNPSNKKLFEYLTMFLLLYQDAKSFYEIVEKFYPSMNYEKMPRHIQEGLLVYMHQSRDYEFSILKKYPIEKEIFNRFEMYNKEYESVKAKRAVNKLKERYGDTFYYYFLNRKPIMLEAAYDYIYE